LLFAYDIGDESAEFAQMTEDITVEPPSFMFENNETNSRAPVEIKVEQPWDKRSSHVHHYPQNNFQLSSNDLPHLNAIGSKEFITRNSSNIPVFVNYQKTDNVLNIKTEPDAHMEVQAPNTSPGRRFSNPSYQLSSNFSAPQHMFYGPDQHLSPEQYRNTPSSSSGSALSSSRSGEESAEFSFNEESEDDLKALEFNSKFTLPTSKSPIIEAFAFCAAHNWGVSIIHNFPDTLESHASVLLLVTNFAQYYRFSSAICSKQHPTKDVGARIKALKRWFVNFPQKKERKTKSSFYLEVKPDHAQKVYEMLDKYIER